ncbi:MAG TPA: hypothetical protein VID24_04585 [Candidatus Eremiobacteraceae bacterium]
MALALCSQSATAGQRYYGTPVYVTGIPDHVNFATLREQAQAGSTVPFFQNTVMSPLDGHTYTFQIIGSDPTLAPASTTVQYVPVVLVVHFSNGVVLDPRMPGCSDTVSVKSRFFKSPLFTNANLVSNGINVGNTQIIDAFQRAEFWSLVGGTGYHMLLAPAKAIKVVNITAPAGSTTAGGACTGLNHDLGEIPFGSWDSIMRTEATKFATPTELPVIMAYNIVLTSGGCCIIGYHNAFGTGTGTQTYAYGAYTDPGIFSPGLQDIHAYTHELGEWANDPFVNNATPAWGHVGQVGGCQNNLEVGDPLTGTPFLVTKNGFTYHPQELAFFDWFFRTPSKGTAAKYSFEGRFTTTQGVCH